MTDREDILYSLVRALTDVKDLINDLGDISDMPKEESTLLGLLKGMAEYGCEKIEGYMREGDVE